MKKPKIIIFFLLIALVLVGASCGEKKDGATIEEENGYIVYSNESWNFEFKYSEDWDLEFEEESDVNLAFALNSPRQDDSIEASAGFLIVAYIPEEGKIFNEEVQKSIDQLKVGQVLIDYSEKSLAGRYAYEVIYSDSPSDPKTKQLHYFVDGGDIWYQLLYMAKQDIYNNHLGTIEDMINSFKIIK